MNWKQQLYEYETKKDWKSAIAYAEQITKDYPEDVDVWLSVIYLLFNCILEESYDIINPNELTSSLLRYFQFSYKKFKNNPEYLFFVGTLGHVAEWLFGYSETDFATKMIKHGLELEPNNRLLMWEYEMTKINNNLSEEKNSLALQRAREIEKEILHKDSPEVKWLLSKGALGRYILDIQLGLSAYDKNLRDEVLGLDK
ncbi:MAG: hypothetical protein L7H18_01890 [Candidatus Nealsonbacteria bacterium DGGOD1a]|jgi:hypothetical protein|nr:MAG: hypothetical protein L7H18_01890 [Candidatus Nealsonbacteria bacterium DGGOD1a]